MNKQQENFFPYVEGCESENGQVESFCEDELVVFYPASPVLDEYPIVRFPVIFELPPIIAKELQYK